MGDWNSPLNVYSTNYWTSIEGQFFHLQFMSQVNDGVARIMLFLLFTTILIEAQELKWGESKDKQGFCGPNCHYLPGAYSFFIYFLHLLSTNSSPSATHLQKSSLMCWLMIARNLALETHWDWRPLLIHLDINLGSQSNYKLSFRSLPSHAQQVTLLEEVPRPGFTAFSNHSLPCILFILTPF